jgi:hypothetical protein
MTVIESPFLNRPFSRTSPVSRSGSLRSFPTDKYNR